MSGVLNFQYSLVRLHWAMAGKYDLFRKAKSFLGLDTVFMVISKLAQPLPSMSLHDLKSLILSHHSLVVMETTDTARATELLDAAAESIQIPLFRWSLHHASNNSSLSETLGLAEQMETEAIFLLEDLDDELDEPQLQGVLQRVCSRFRYSRSCLVLVGTEIELPSELDSEAAWFQLRLPDSDELRQLLDELLAESHGLNSNQSDLSANEREAVVAAMKGMTRNQARQSLMRAIFEQHGVEADDVGNRERAKTAVVRADGLVEFFPAGEHSVELPGFGNLCAWIDQPTDLMTARSVLLAGVEVSGNSVAVQIVAHRKRLPLLKFDAARLEGLSSQEAEEQFAHAASIAKSVAPCVFWLDNVEQAAGKTANPNILSAVLAWTGERSENPDIFFVATAHNLGALPVEFAPAAAFDEIFFIDLPTAAERANIWDIHLRQRQLEQANFDIGFLVDASEGFSSDEIEQTIVASLYRAAEQRRPLDQQLLTGEIYATVPLSMSHAAEFSRIRREAAGKAVPASEPDHTAVTLAA